MPVGFLVFFEVMTSSADAKSWTVLKSLTTRNIILDLFGIEPRTSTTYSDAPGLPSATMTAPGGYTTSITKVASFSRMTAGTASKMGADRSLAHLVIQILRLRVCRARSKEYRV